MKNTGNTNTGDWNTGYRNTGDRNTGDCNTGDCNTGYRNTGYRNTGDCNTGYRNTGDCNIGDCNTGDWNTGNRNTGNWNTGDWNTGYRNTGFFNNETPTEVLAFGKMTNRDAFVELCQEIDFLYFNAIEFIYKEDMTEQEKEENPTYETTGGYLKTYEYKEAFQNSYNSLSEEERIKQTKLLRDLPNFDKDIFFDISGIDVDKEPKLSKEEYIKKHEDELYQKYLNESD